ncbi:MAG: hypothetical protein PHV60_04995, partial [bacterium]|nr:hypothetical protein [bacterium]
KNGITTDGLTKYQLLTCYFEREIGNIFVGDVYFDITMTMSNEQVSFRVVTHMDLPAQGGWPSVGFNSAERTGLAKKIPLGKSVSAFVPTPSKYKVYVPSRYGGKLQVKTSAGNVRLFYPDFNTAVSSSTANLTYDVPKDKFGWYYIKVSSATVNYTISNTFYEEGEVAPERKPWNISTWWPPSDVFDDGNSVKPIENTYDVILPKYDTVVGLSGTNSATEWEKRQSVLEGWQGHYIYNGNARETHAEKDFKYDWNHSGVVEDPGPFDFYNSNSGSFGIGDGDLNDIYDTTWWGHCDGWCRAAIIYNDPDNLIMKNGFIAEEVKALFTELGMALYEGGIDYEEYKFNPNIISVTTNKFHHLLRKYLGNQQKAIFGNLKAISRNSSSFSEVWNHPIWYYKAEMVERQNVPEDEKLVNVKLTLKAADDTGDDYREDSDRSEADKIGGYGGPAWQYHLLFDANGDISNNGNGWDTYSVDDPNKLWYIPRLFHLGDYSEPYHRNPKITEQNIQLYVIDGSLKRSSW